MSVVSTVPERSEFSAPTRIVAFPGCARARLAGELRALGTTRVAVIADRGFAEAGMLERLLAAAGGKLSLPVCALCAGKAVAIRLRNPPPLGAYIGSGRLPAPPAPVIAIPTTAGSGSEVSNVVVLHDPDQTRHLVIRGRGYEPRVALLDGELLRTLPRRPLVYAALDALSHALESLWVHGASAFTDALAGSAADSIARALPGALEGEDDALQQLLEASTLANLACGNSGLGLVHALSSAPGVRLAHGYQNGVLLPHVAAFNLPEARAVAAERIATLAPLYDRIGFLARFAPGELTRRDIDAMVGAALANPFRENNCRLAQEADLRSILSAAG
jgi:alcohol dehydrogenase class IV